MHALIGLLLGAIASIPAHDPVVTITLSLLVAVDAGITGFIFREMEKAR